MDGKCAAYLCVCVCITKLNCGWNGNELSAPSLTREESSSQHIFKRYALDNKKFNFELKNYKQFFKNHHSILKKEKKLIK